MKRQDARPFAPLLTSEHPLPTLARKSQRLKLHSQGSTTGEGMASSKEQCIELLQPGLRPGVHAPAIPSFLGPPSPGRFLRMRTIGAIVVGILVLACGGRF